MSATSPATSQSRRLDLISAALIVAAAFAVRAWLFGDPLIHVDENFYLLVGDRMLHGGALPYVDIWDRKPVGLFLLYAAIRLLGGDGIVQYQVVATLFAAGTGLVIARIAAPMAGRGPATVAAILYILLLSLAGGAGGQAPVFYTLFVAGAAWAVASLAAEPASPERIRRRGAVAMGLIGLGLQIKYTVVFEGVFFGLTLMWASWRASRDPARLAIDMTLWVVLALAPTMLALAWYAVLGQEEAFIYANFLSIGARGGADHGELLRRLVKTWTVLQLPLLAVLLAAVLAPWRRFPRGEATFRFTLAWLGAAVAGYLAFGTYFNHYALPLFAPLAAATAPLFAYRRRQLGLIAAGAMLLAGAGAVGVTVRKMTLKRGGPAEMAAMVAAIKPRLTNCLYVWNGDPMLYHLTGSCLPTRYPFAGHLNLLREHGAIGIDQAGEVRRILAAKPKVIVDRQPTARDFNFAVVAIVEAELRRDYRPVAVIPLGRARTIIYERRPDR